MTPNTGRTNFKWLDFIIHDSDGTLRSIPVTAINGVGFTVATTDQTAFQDAITNALPGHLTCVINIAGPWDSVVVAAAGTLSGSHTVLSPLPGLTKPLTLDVQIGVRQAWETGEPQFGITASATSGFLCSSYVVDVGAGTYTASFYVTGVTAPAWGTAAET